ncbi:cytochrome c5 family protein [Pseudomonas kielensis]|uniref:c-type cytochrome n=1 Tax=Pseudomonas kielensis TaxID=2762577 RepID=UPI00389DA9C7
MWPSPPFSLRIVPISLLAALIGLLSACGDESPPAATTNHAANAMPSDPSLAPIYDTSCKICHANPASGAPQTGDAKAWTPRIAQGADTLLDHIINGYNGMPPMGLCVQCSEEQFLALTAFMSSQEIQ